MEIPFPHWEMWLHFRNRSARRILPSPCDKHLHNKHLYHTYSPWHDGCYVNRSPPLTNFMKTISIPPPAPICMSPFRSDTILPNRAAPSVILDEGYRLSRTGQSFFRPIRTFLSGLVCFVGGSRITSRRLPDKSPVENPSKIPEKIRKLLRRERLSMGIGRCRLTSTSTKTQMALRR